MIKRELKYNFNSFLVWLIVSITMFLMIYLVYPSIINSNEFTEINKMMNIFPKELLVAFNLDIASIDSAFGWIKSEGMTILILILGCYSALLGSNILLKEENDKTIEYLNYLPISRKKIVLTKFVVGIIYIGLITLLITLFNYFGLLQSGKFDAKLFFLLSFTTISSSLVFYSISFFISTFFHKSKKMLSISLGLVFISYFLQIISQMSDSVKFLKYFSINSLANSRDIILNNEYNFILALIAIIIVLGLLFASIKKYENKELV